MATANNNNKSKKRKRQEKLQQYGVDLPEIPGVPVEVIPILVHALKVATKFFSKASVAFNVDWEEVESEDSFLTTSKRSAWMSHNNHGSNTNINTNALDNVLNRIDDTAAEESEERKQQHQCQLNMKNAVQSWLQAVKRFAAKKRYDHPKDPTTATDNTNASHNNASSSSRDQNRNSVPLCCFRYISDLGMEHKRLAVRRAALYMNRLLLDKSCDCRRYFLGESLWPWLQMLRSTAGGEGFDVTKQRLWQQEGHKLLLHLLSQNYGDLYPKLAVAEQYLRQACSLELVEPSPSTGAEEGEEFGTTTNLASLRKLRDIAMEHGAEELRRVKKLIQRCHKCMDILVPRLGEPDEPAAKSLEQPSLPLASGTLLVDGDDDDDEADDDIDWEDGWEAEDNDPSQEGLSEQGHASAVELTLQAMESMGGFKGGVLEIDMNDTHTNPVEEKLSAASSPGLLAARERFTKCAGRLADRHLPRIRAWLEGLVKADRLFSNNRKSLVLMSFEQGQHRDQLRKSLVDLKAQMLSVMESAARLGLLTVKTNVAAGIAS